MALAGNVWDRGQRNYATYRYCVCKVFMLRLRLPIILLCHGYARQYNIE